MSLNCQHILLHLSLIDGIGSATIAQIVECKPADLPWQELYALSAQEFSAIFRFSSDKAQCIVQGLSDKALVEQELERIEHHSISWCSVLDANYPVLLKQSYAPPTVLYWRGNLPALGEQALAVVGSRQANAYGERVIKTLLPPLIAQGWHIVSGGAVGADSIAHAHTIAAGGFTVAVLGSGLLKPYPTTNHRLFSAIVEHGGALVSSFPLTTTANPGNFPARNRIIAALSRGCMVVQAAQKSGALITAHYALEYGREVFAVPGPIDDPLSAGCHALLQQGAKLVAQASDISGEFGMGSEVIIPHNMYIQADQTVVEPVATSPQAKLQDFCRLPRSLDEIVAFMELDQGILQAMLFDLQLQGLVMQNFACMWEQKER